MPMIICQEKQARVLRVTGQDERTLKVLISPALNAGLTELAAGLSIIPPRSQSDRVGHAEGELFYVCEGQGRILIGEETADLVPATVVWAPPHTVHQLINTGADILKVLWVLCPSGRERSILAHAADATGDPHD
jgi:mannose-6-phosphate isomerase-like protein (cupin superfamily)